MGVLDYLPQAEQIRDATAAGENTASRVGGCMVGIITECNTSFQQLAAALAAMPGAPWDGYAWNQDLSTGNQYIELTSNGVTVASLLIKCATQSASGFMSATDKQKLDALDAAAVAGSLSYQEVAGVLSLVLTAADGSTQLAVVQLPNVGNDTMSEAVNTGVLTAAQKNWTDLAAGCLIVYCSGQRNVNVDSVGRVYAGQVMTCDVFSADAMEGTVARLILIDRGGNILWTAVGPAEVGSHFEIDIDSVLYAANLTNTIEIGSIRLTTDNEEVVARLSLREKSSGGGDGVVGFSVYRQSTSVMLYGVDRNGLNIASAMLERASSSMAGVMGAADKQKLDALPDSETLRTEIANKAAKTAAVGVLDQPIAAANTLTLEYGTAEETPSRLGSVSFPAATTTKAGVMTAAQASKLAGIDSDAEPNVINEVKVDGTPLVPSDKSVNIPVTTKMQGQFPNAVPPVGQDGLISPADNSNYYLGQVNSLGFSWYMSAMDIGATISFEATENFDIVVPFDDGLNTPTTAGMCAQQAILSCESGRQYCLSIIAINAAGSAKVNLFNLVEIITPT